MAFLLSEFMVHPYSFISDIIFHFKNLNNFSGTFYENDIQHAKSWPSCAAACFTVGVLGIVEQGWSWQEQVPSCQICYSLFSSNNQTYVSCLNSSYWSRFPIQTKSERCEAEKDTPATWETPDTELPLGFSMTLCGYFGCACPVCGWSTSSASQDTQSSSEEDGLELTSSLA